MKKTFVLDTNVLLHNPNALFSFDDNDIVIPDVVIDELDNHKRSPGELGANARQASRMLDAFRSDTKNGTLLSGYLLPSGGTLRVEMNCLDVKMPSSWTDSNDLRILRVAKSSPHNILISNDSFLRIKASILNIESQEFTTESVPSDRDLFSGRRDVLISEQDLSDLYSGKSIDVSNLLSVNKNIESLKNHEYLLCRCLTNPSQSILCIVNKNQIIKLNNPDSGVFGLSPRNVGQKFLIDALKRPAKEAPLVICKGPAGTGKTLLAIAAGLEAVVDTGEYKRGILYLRGNTKLDEDIGFLPGTEEEKLDWILRPVRDNLEVILNCSSDNRLEAQSKIDYFFDKRYISVEAVAHMRGRSIASTFVIIDEAQNLTPKQIRTLLSRSSKDSKIILLGDPYQIDHPFLDFRTNGLCYAADRMAGSPTTFQTTMLNSECERSELSIEVFERMTDKGSGFIY